jgi:hypothetical protein
MCCSVVHDELHPSPLTMFPSSHCSFIDIIPFPQIIFGKFRFGVSVIANVFEKFITQQQTMSTTHHTIPNIWVREALLLALMKRFFMSAKIKL